MKKINRHIGVYGTAWDKDKILLVKKTRDPYIGRFDLPGGKIDRNESLVGTLEREFIEETGHHVTIKKHLTTKDFFIDSIKLQGMEHHIALMYEVVLKDKLNSDRKNI